MQVRAINGQTRVDAWVRRRELPFRQRLAEAGRFTALSLVGGAFLFVPLVHLFGLVFALVMNGMAVARLRAVAVLDGAGGICPRCGHAGVFFVGLGRRRFQLPTEASCEKCGVDLTLQPL